jgi:hypothetical protein
LLVDCNVFKCARTRASPPKHQTVTVVDNCFGFSSYRLMTVTVAHQTTVSDEAKASNGGDNGHQEGAKMVK